MTADEVKLLVQTSTQEAVTQAMKSVVEMMGQQKKAEQEAAEAAKTLGGEGGKKNLLKFKDMKLSDFNGNMDEWDDWALAFRKAVKTQSKKAYDKIVKLEAEKVEPVDEQGYTPDEVSMSTEIYDILCQVCKGEALTLVRSVDDCMGFMAWWKLKK